MIERCRQSGGDTLDRAQYLGVADRDQVWAAGAGNCRYQAPGVGHQDCKCKHGDDRADEDAGELSKKRLTRVRTKQFLSKSLKASSASSWKSIIRSCASKSSA